MKHRLIPTLLARPARMRNRFMKLLLALLAISLYVMITIFFRVDHTQSLQRIQHNQIITGRRVERTHDVASGGLYPIKKTIQEPIGKIIHGEKRRIQKNEKLGKGKIVRHHPLSILSYENEAPAAIQRPMNQIDEKCAPLLGQPPIIKALCPDCVDYTCKQIFSNTNTATYYKTMRTFLERKINQTKPRYTSPSILKFLKSAGNCGEFKKKYHMSPMDEEEAIYPLAFSIIMHRNFNQVGRLLRAIYRPQNVYCIHIDQYAPASVHAAMETVVKCFDNVFIASKLERIHYSGYSRLQADINCMKDLVNSEIKWKYLMNMAGEAFPLMTNAEMVKVLKIYNGSNDIEGIPRKDLGARMQYQWLERDEIKLPIKTMQRNPPPPHNLTMVKGSAYGTFSRAFVEFVLTDKKAIDLLNWSRLTYSPDEIYWATLHHTRDNPWLKTPGGYPGIPNKKEWLSTFAAWGGTGWGCQGKNVRGVCVFGAGDLPRLIERKEFTVNKFYTDLQPIAYECMEAWLEYKTQCPQPLDLDFYNSLPFIRRGDFEKNVAAFDSMLFKNY